MCSSKQGVHGLAQWDELSQNSWALGLGWRGSQMSPGKCSGLQAAEWQLVPWLQEGSHLHGDSAAVPDGSQSLAPCPAVCLCIYMQDLDKVAGGDP